MMYAKLALRNVKRSAKDYLIYVITLILSVGLFYGFMSIASPYYNESLPVKINLEILNKAMRIAVPIVALLVIFLISYVNTYMLRRKQKEFAVQTIIGMEQRTVAFIFFMETMIMGAISIILGILLGIGLSQIVGYIVVQSFEVEWQPYLSLFPDTILFTLLFFGAIFIVMGIRNIRTVRQLKIIDMLHNSQRGNEKIHFIPSTFQMDCDSSHSFNRCLWNDVCTHNESVNSTAYSLATHCIGNSSYAFDSGCDLVFHRM